MKNENQLVNECVDALKQGLRLLDEIEDQLYTETRGLPVRSGVGSHIRHCLDFYRSFLSGIEMGRVDYNKRARDERGAGVSIVKSEPVMEHYLRLNTGDTIIQEYAPGLEFGVFYYRRPPEERGRIFSITEKLFPAVTGDGTRTLEQLILADKRAVCMARAYFKEHREHLADVPDTDQSVPLVELGTHCRGAVFLDGIRFKTDELEAAIDRLSKNFEGFYFGRFDLRAASHEDFMRGMNFKVVELNGVTAEATHIYDPRYGLFDAYRILFEQWRIAFEIGAQNRARGIRPTSLRTLCRLLISSAWKRRSARQRPQEIRGNINCPSVI